MKRMTAAVLIVLSLGAAAPAFARTHYYYVGRNGVVYRTHRVGYRNHRVVYGPGVVVHRAVVRPLHRVHRHLVRHASDRFIPLPVPRGLPVPPPFRHAF